MRLSNPLRRVDTSYHSIRQLGSGACVFTAVYLIALIYVRSITSRDPGSWFFNPRTAYIPILQPLSAARDIPDNPFIYVSASHQ
jgi:hypothetical protein